jgi:hypothetical protein
MKISSLHLRADNRTVGDKDRFKQNLPSSLVTITGQSFTRNGHIQPLFILARHFVSTWMMRISGICMFQFAEMDSKMSRKSRSSPGFMGAMLTG